MPMSFLFNLLAQPHILLEELLIFALAILKIEQFLSSTVVVEFFKGVVWANFPSEIAHQLYNAEISANNF